MGGSLPQRPLKFHCRKNLDGHRLKIMQYKRSTFFPSLIGVGFPLQSFCFCSNPAQSFSFFGMLPFLLPLMLVQMSFRVCLDQCFTQILLPQTRKLSCCRCSFCQGFPQPQQVVRQMMDAALPSDTVRIQAPLRRATSFI